RATACRAAHPARRRVPSSSRSAASWRAPTVFSAGRDRARPSSGLRRARQRLGPRLAVEIETAERCRAGDGELLLLPAARGEACGAPQLPRGFPKEDLRVAAALGGRGLGDQLLRFSREPGQGRGHRLARADAELAVRGEDAGDGGEAGGGEVRAPAVGEAGIHPPPVPLVTADV